MFNSTYQSPVAPCQKFRSSINPLQDRKHYAVLTALLIDPVTPDGAAIAIVEPVASLAPPLETVERTELIS